MLPPQCHRLPHHLTTGILHSQANLGTPALSLTTLGHLRHPKGSFHRWQPRGREMPLSEIMLWATPKGPPRALQTSECRELLNPTRTSCLILAQRQPGKLRNQTKLKFHPIQHHFTSGIHPDPGVNKIKRSGVAETARFTSELTRSTQAHYPSTEHVERFCLLCCQPWPVLISLSARVPQLQPK